MDFTAPKATVGNTDVKIEVKSPGPILKFNYLSHRNDLQKGLAVAIYPNEMGRTIVNVTRHVSEWGFRKKMHGTLMLASYILLSLALFSLLNVLKTTATVEKKTTEGYFFGPPWWKNHDLVLMTTLYLRCEPKKLGLRN